MVLVSCTRCANRFEVVPGIPEPCPRCGKGQTVPVLGAAGWQAPARAAPAYAPAPQEFFPVAAPRTTPPATAMVGCFLLAAALLLGIPVFALEPVPPALALMTLGCLLGGTIVLIVGARPIGTAQRVLASIAVGLHVVALALGGASDRQMAMADTVDEIKGAIATAIAHDFTLMLAIVLALWCVGRHLERTLLVAGAVLSLVLELVVLSQFEAAALGDVDAASMDALTWSAVLVQILPMAAAAILAGSLLPRRVGQRGRRQPALPGWASASRPAYAGGFPPAFEPLPPAAPPAQPRPPQPAAVRFVAAPKPAAPRLVQRPPSPPATAPKAPAAPKPAPARPPQRPAGPR